MDELLKQIEKILTQYFNDCKGNKLTQWAWMPFGKLILDTIKNYKPKNEVIENDVKK